MSNPTHTTEPPEIESDSLMMSRTGSTDIFGKLDDEIPPIRINGDMLDEARRKAREAGYNLSEYVRNLVYINLRGMEHIESLRADKMRRAFGNASQTPSNGGAK